MARPGRTARALTLVISGLWIFLAMGTTVGAVHALVRAPGPAGAHTFHPLLHSSAVSSTNWAGWAATGSSGSVSDVKGSWIVPKIQGTCPAGKYQYSSFWVGIDGYSSSTVEQLGTDSDCQSGTATYYAWYEFYPNPSHLISKLTIHPGNVITAEVKYVSGHFTVKMTDKNTSVSFSKNATVTSAKRTSAEWIAEAPSSSSGVLPLANFGTVYFGNQTTKITGTCYATISGTSSPIGSFANTDQITMINNAGTQTKASTSALSTSGTSFSVAWKSAGP